MLRRIIPHGPRTSFATTILGAGEIVFDTTGGVLYMGDGVTAGGVAAWSGGAAVWGGIGGTLGNQADLVAVLAGKQAADPQLDALAALAYLGNGGKGLRFKATEDGFEPADFSLVGHSHAPAAISFTTTARFLGRTSANAGGGEELTPAQATALLDIFTTSAKGLVPSPAGTSNTTDFLRRDGVWAAPPAPTIAPIAIARQVAAGRFYPPSNMTFSANAVTVSANLLIGVPFNYGIAIKGLVMEVTTAAVAGAAIRLGIYDCGADGKPGALILDAGTVTADTAAVKVLAIAERVMSKPFWLAFVASADTPLRAGVAADASMMHTLFGSTSMSAATTSGCVFASHTYGPLPATFPAASVSAGLFMIAAQGR
ncbi:MAG: hypothetical protein M3Q08_03600 [Pseudomonadota bacterium]|nr:hypothetical protein [Pseudomonadota bacterium]